MKCIQSALASAAVLALAGCTVIEPPRYAADHPANPTAPAAAPEPAPAALSTYRTFGGTTQEPSREDGHAHQH
jgi:hypothetical protein